MGVAFQFPREFVPQVVAVCADLLSKAPGAYIPNTEELTTVLHAALWASIQRDEDRGAVFSISISPKDSSSRVLALKNPIELSAESLLKFAVATIAEESAVHVGTEDGQLQIFGVDTLLGTNSPVWIEVRGPAMLVVKAGRRSGSVAVIAGSVAALIDREYYRRYQFVSDEGQFGFDLQRDREHRITRVVQSMVNYGHGGTILLVPDETSVSSLPLDLLYPLDGAFPGLRRVDDGVKSSMSALAIVGRSEQELREAHGEFHSMSLLRDRYAAAVAKTTSVDGATLLTHDGSLLGFGAKIRTSNKELFVQRTRPIVGEPTWTDAVGEFGGTRHQSAARFVAEAPADAVWYAVVASQDGRLSIVSRDEQGGPIKCLEHAEWLF